MNPDQIKEWMKRTGLSRRELAQKCGVSPATVNGWLSAGRAIPGPARRILDEMANGGGLNPVISLETFNRLQRRAEREGKSLNELVAEILAGAAGGTD